MPCQVVMEIEPIDAELRAVLALCPQLALAELRRCLDNEVGEEIEHMTWNDHSAFKDQFQIEKSAGLEGVAKLVNLLKQHEDREFAEWLYDMVSRYLAQVSEIVGVSIEVVDTV